MPKKIVIPAVEDLWDEATETFVGGTPERTVILEHSLYSIALWESIWEVPYLDEKPKTNEQMISYIECMNVDYDEEDHFGIFLSPKNMEDINNYLGKKMSATWFKEDDKEGKHKNKRIITSELIYNWMFNLQIPLECEHWNFNRLMTQIRVCSEENKTPEKQSKSDMIKNRRSLNAARRARSHSRG